MTDTCTFRPFRDGDLPRLHEIRNEAYKPVFRSFRNLLGEDIAAVALVSAEKEQGDYLDTCCSPESPREVHVALKGNEIVGFVTTLTNDKTGLGILDLNAVDPAHQGEGIGTLIYEWALAHLKDSGMKVAEVGTGGDESHAAARRAYEKAGFGPSIPNVYYYKKL